MRKLFYINAIAAILVGGCKNQDGPRPTQHSRDFRAGVYYDYYQKKDSAVFYYNRVIQNSVDSFEKATAYFNTGLRQLEAGDYYSAQESFLSSLKGLDDHDTSQYETISASYNSLANATLALKDYESAIRNYNLALHFSPGNASKVHVLNNLGVAYQKQGAYKKAIASFDAALATNVADTSLKAKLLSNKERTRWLADSAYLPQPGFKAALTLQRLIHDSLGMNASFAHLAEYYAKAKPDSALYYALKRLEIAQRLADPNDRLEALNQLIKLSPPNRTKGYVQGYLQLNDSLNDVHNRDRNQFALIKFDAEKSKADNLLLERNVSRQRQIIVVTLVLAVGLVIALSLRAKVRRRKIKAAADQAIQQAKLNTSQKVHDVVANGLYRVMNELEHRDAIDKEDLLDRIETLYERSRNISYEDEDTEATGYRQRIQWLIASFENSRTTVRMTDHLDGYWERLTAPQRRELEKVMEELMVNMQKHSRATAVVVGFRRQGNKICVEYADNGTGFGPNHREGNGLRSTVNRIKSINGEISFGNSGESGARVVINFPLESTSL